MTTTYHNYRWYVLITLVVAHLMQGMAISLVTLLSTTRYDAQMYSCGGMRTTVEMWLRHRYGDS